MAISNNTSYILKEWAPLTDLLNKIPTKPNLSIFSGEVKITCVDILTEFIALGTNYGMAYWYDRKKKDLQRLRCENYKIPLTFIKVLSTVDFMLACGSKSGNISIFQIPKVHPDWIPEHLKPKQKTVERYTVCDLHKSAITSLEWSKNGMKLFSGDENGTVVLTEIDFYMHICKSLEILNESYEIVQLSYSNPKLIVSTTYRSIICEKTDKWNVIQIGQKDRKILGKFGGIIQQNKIQSKEAVIYCTRPGLRIWISDSEGNVQKTLLFKELLSKNCTEVSLLNPVSKNSYCNGTKEQNFGIVLPFGENLLVTYNSSIIYILDPISMTVVSKISQLRKVLAVACHKEEILILEEDRSLIRLSPKPEENHASLSSSSSVDNYFIPNTLRELTTKLQPSNVLMAIPPVIEQAFTYSINEHTDGELVMNAEEAVETTNEIPQNTNYSKYSEQVLYDADSTDIIYKQKKHKRKGQDKEKPVINSFSSNSSNEENINVVRPTMMNLSTVGALPDLRSPQSIQNDIEYKEKILADVLNFDKKLSLKLSNVESETNTVIKNETIAIKNDEKIAIKNDERREINEVMGETSKRNEPIKKKSVKDKPSTKAIPIKKKSEPPACVNIPNGWNLSSVKLSSPSTSPSLSDWEVL